MAESEITGRQARVLEGLGELKKEREKGEAVSPADLAAHLGWPGGAGVVGSDLRALAKLGRVKGSEESVGGTAHVTYS